MTNAFYDEIENTLISDLTKKKVYTEIHITKIIEYFRLLNFNSKILTFFMQKNLLTAFVLNVIHYNIVNKKAFKSVNKILDLQLLFDFEGETFNTTNFWKCTNIEFKQYLKKN